MVTDAKALRSAFSRFVTGVTVVTTRGVDGAPVGFTANSFTSVSLDPPLVLVCPGNHLSTFEVFRNANRFGVSILAEGQQHVSNLFASRQEDRFSTCDWQPHATGIPLISGRAAGFVCDSFHVLDAGDHVVLIGQVIDFDDACLPGLGYGPNGYFEQTREREAQAPPVQSTRASVLLDDGRHLYLTADQDLPTASVPAGTSPLRALTARLEAAKIRFNLNVVYAIYDEGPHARRIVFRGQTKGPQPGLTKIPTQNLPDLNVQDEALKALLTRFAQEHSTQNFGFYIGDAHDGDVLPTSER
ncbi:flavin reductase family protein [uncultured Roseobacter sp.]|uniref:flavin reductase family protein n=1 Tax=uncultured Roseobacter sp. TaxID=114847 RepID=UPI002610123D|nr:flavin reductase family protein [uncultured Roseobacter sp.]